MTFNDGSTIQYEGKGEILVTYKKNEEMVIPNVLYLHDLKANILSLGKLDDEGCITLLSSSVLMVHDKFCRLMTKTKKTRGNLYQPKINISEKCNLIKEDNCEMWLCHKRFCHQSFYTLKDMISGNLVRGLLQI